MRLMQWLILIGLLAVNITSAALETEYIRSVVDDSGYKLTLTAPAQRVITLSPHATEWVYRIGAGERLIATIAFSDYPPQAQSIPRIGNANRIDIERVVMLKPDLLIAWQSGNGKALINQLRTLGINVYVSQPRALDDIPKAYERLGQLLNVEQQARDAANIFRSKLEQLRLSTRLTPAVSVFYQIWDKPLMTLNGKHIINEAITLCGGANIFANLPTLAPSIALEAVLAENPQMIILANEVNLVKDWEKQWRVWTSMRAVAANQVFTINPDIIQRPTFRILEGTEHLCRLVEQVRVDVRQTAAGQ